MKTKTHTRMPQRSALHLLLVSAFLVGLWSIGNVRAADAPAHAASHAAAKPAEEKKELIEIPLIKQRKAEMAAAAAAAAEASAPAAGGKESSEAVKQLRKALTVIGTPVKSSATEASEKSAGAAALKPVAHGTPSRRMAPAASGETLQSSREATRARALALARGEPVAHAEAEGHGGEVHWSYEGENGPQNWAKLKPEFSLCGVGKRQSPIAIQNESTLQGPAEPLQFNYTPSRGVVVNNGHTVQVDVDGENNIVVRNTSFKLLQFHFHTPSEEMINSKRYSMVAHLVHKNEAGQLAVVAVLMEQGEANPFIDKVWTYMPLDSNDRVRMPEGLLDVNELLPKDQRYYQFMGSLTTPPCTEGVLWMVLKQPVKISAAQYRLFRQQFPINARPVQPVNGRPVREAQ
jgi:carbonic anhydrase